MYAPDIFLAGAPKSGTTYLFDLIVSHPSITGPDIKETYFFIDADNPYLEKGGGYHNANQDYSKKFGMKAGKLCVDGTTHTMYQESVSKYFSKSANKPSMIFLLREPARRILSSFQYTSQNMAAIRGLKFDKYVEFLLSDDVTGLRKYCKNDKAFYSLSNELVFSRYVQHLDRWRWALGRERLLVLTSESFWQDPNATLDRIAEFLEVDAFWPENAQFRIRSNETYEVKNKVMHYSLKQLIEFMNISPPQNWVRLYKQMFTSKCDRKIEDLNVLKRYFDPFNKALKERYQLDISLWSS